MLGKEEEIQIRSRMVPDTDIRGDANSRRQIYRHTKECQIQCRESIGGSSCGAIVTEQKGLMPQSGDWKVRLRREQSIISISELRVAT